ncbi:MAG: TonB-dependent receptor domain-containing protein [Janthinobacterium lividum]
MRDPSGAAIPETRVTLESIGTGLSSTLTSDRLGEFFFPELAPGSYRVRIQAAGFDPLRISGEEVVLGRTTRMAPSLRIGGVTQAVSVETADDLPLFDSPVNGNLQPSELQALPLDGRRFQSLAPLTPLVDADDAAPADPADSNGAGENDTPAPDTDNVRLTVRGLDPLHNQYTLDGLSLTRAFDGEPRGGRTLPFTVAEEGVREFQVRAVGEGTARGRDAGGSVNTVSRRGEAGVHGSAFFLLRNSGAGAANPFAVSTRYNNGSPTATLVKPLDVREQFGGSIGGPLLRSVRATRVFGFVAAEGQRRSFPGISSPSDPNFYKLSPIQTALLANRGVNAAATAKALNFLDGLTGPVARRADELALFPRVDWQPGSRTSLTAEWAHVRFRSPSGQRSAPVVPLGRASFGDVTTHTDSAMLHANAALSARWLGTVRAQYSRDAAFAETPPPLASEPQTGPGGAAPEVSIAGAFSFGNAASLGARRLPEERRTELAAETSFNGRAHTVRLGVDFSAVDERIGSREASAGAYDFTSGTTNGRAGGLVDFITDSTYSSTSYPNGGCPSIYAAVHLFCFRSFTQSFGSVPETRFHIAELSTYVDDSWRATPRLRISAGVRYEYNRLPPPQHPNAALDSVLATVTSDFAASGNMPADTNNLAPHVGIAYAPGRRTVVRASYGVHFGEVPGRTLQATLENTAQPQSQTRLRLTPRTVLDPSCASAGTNFGYPATYVCSPFGPVAAAGSVTVFVTGFQVPFVQTGEFSVTRELTRTTTLNASYVFGLNRQLQNTTDLNIAPSTSRIAFSIVRNGGEAGRAAAIFSTSRSTPHGARPRTVRSPASCRTATAPTTHWRYNCGNAHHTACRVDCHGRTARRWITCAPPAQYPTRTRSSILWNRCTTERPRTSTDRTASSPPWCGSRSWKAAAVPSGSLSTDGALPLWCLSAAAGRTATRSPVAHR